MLEATDWSCGRIKGPTTYGGWKNDDVSNSVIEKCKLCSEWKQGNTSKEKYQGKCKPERKAFGNVM